MNNGVKIHEDWANVRPHQQGVIDYVLSIAVVVFGKLRKQWQG
jgi:hypothetical protein